MAVAYSRSLYKNYIALEMEGDKEIVIKTDHVFYLPLLDELLLPILMTVPLQLHACFIAV